MKMVGATHVPKEMSQSINVLSTATASDNAVTVGGNTAASGFCDRADNPVVDEWLKCADSSRTGLAITAILLSLNHAIVRLGA